MNRLLSLMILVTVAGALGCTSTAVAADEKRPNIVLILSDDQAWTDYGFMGHPVIQTPHLDALADQSLLFKRGYVPVPICRPSLASIATGVYPFEHGVTGNDVNGSKDRPTLDPPLTQGFYRHPTFIQMLTDSGYLAHQSGKWWEGSYADAGFTHGMTHGDVTRGGRHGDEGLAIGREGFEPIEQFMDLAIEQDKPFFVWYAPFLPHTPHNPPQRLLDKYTAEGRAMDVAKYYAMCEWFDETCGELVGLLDERGLREDTIVLYVTDNGWLPASTGADHPSQHLWKNYAQRSKASPYENGIRTPIMVSWPGTVEPKNMDKLATALDFFPTIASLAGIEAPEELPGIDLLDADAVAGRDTIYGVTYSSHNINMQDNDQTLQYLWCIEGDWKLLVRYKGEDTQRYHVLHDWDTEPVRLYNLAADPQEQNDVAANHPDVVKRLRGKVEAWHPVPDELAVKASE